MCVYLCARVQLQLLQGIVGCIYYYLKQLFS